MKILTYCTLILMFCTIGELAVHPDEGNSHAKGADTVPWEEHFITFQQLLNLEKDSQAAHAELQYVAKKLFGEHTLNEEWVPLYFRIRSEGTKHLSDVKRVYELEIRMLTAIGAEKYAKQIQLHQEALKHCKDIHKVIGDQPFKEPINTTKTSDVVNKAFFQLLPDNPEAARAVLDIFATLVFDNHRLTEEWKELYFRLCLAKEATFSEAIRVFELKKQILTDIDAEKHANEIKNLAGVIKQSKSVQKILERQGNPDKKMPFNLAPK